MADLLSFAETQKLLDELPREQQRLVSELIPAHASIGTVQRVLQALLAERVSIRDLPTILEGIHEAASSGIRTVPGIVAQVRLRLARQISDSVRGPQGYIPLHHPLAGVGDGAGGKPARPGGGTAAGTVAGAAVGVHATSARGAGCRRRRRRGAGSCLLGGDPGASARHRRTFPPRHPGAGADRDPPARPHPHHRGRVACGCACSGPLPPAKRWPRSAANSAKRR